jgi:hypothetical protein
MHPSDWLEFQCGCEDVNRARWLLIKIDYLVVFLVTGIETH